MSTLLQAFRRDRFVGMVLALIVLLVPVFHPLAEANAANSIYASEICTTFGQAGKASVPGQADDCPLGGACSLVQLAPVPAHAPVAAFASTRQFALISFERKVCLPALRLINWLLPPGQAPPSQI